MGIAGSAPDGEREAIRSALSESGEPFLSLTAGETTAETGYPRQTATDAPRTRAERGALPAARRDGANPVRWHPEAGDDPAGRRPRPTAFGAFANAVDSGLGEGATVTAAAGERRE